MCFIMRYLYYTVNTDSLKLLYFAHFHSRVNYGKTSGGTCANLHKLFLLQKNIRTMLGLGYRYSCGIQFKQLDMLTIPCLNILSLMNFVVNNLNKFQTNLSVLSLNTKQKNHPHRPTTCFSSIQKGVTYSAIKVFNSLPPHISKFPNKQQFKHALKQYRLTHAFYSWKEFFSDSHKIYK